MKFYVLEPAVSGDISESSADWHVHPAIIKKLHYELDFPSDDALLAFFPIWIVTTQAKGAIQSETFSGVSFDSVEVSKSPNFEELWPDRELPDFVWMKVHGKLGRDDFSIAPDHRLVVSHRALQLLQLIGIPNAEVTEFQE